MITNIIARRTRKHRWKSVQAIIEATENDNGVADADKAEKSDPKHYVMYDERDRISVAEAIAWGSNVACEVTLYLYDEGTN